MEKLKIIINIEVAPGTEIIGIKEDSPLNVKNSVMS